MSILDTNEMPNYYAIVPANVRYDNNLKPNEKLLYAEITALANKNGYCYASNRYFANLYKVAIETVSRWISKLELNKYLKTEIIKTETGWVTERRIYIINTYIPKDQEGIDKKINTSADKNIKYNNININNTRKNKNSFQNYEQRQYPEEFWEQFYDNLRK